MSKAVNVLALVRDGHRYVFLYDDESVDSVLTKLGEYATDPELEFTWYDAPCWLNASVACVKNRKNRPQQKTFRRCSDSRAR